MHNTFRKPHGPFISNCNFKIHKLFPIPNSPIALCFMSWGGGGGGGEGVEWGLLQGSQLTSQSIHANMPVKHALVTTCIKRPLGHVILQYHAFLPLLRDHLYSKTTFFGQSVVA